MQAWMWWAIWGGIVVFAAILHGYLVWDTFGKMRALLRDIEPLQRAGGALGTDISALSARIERLRDWRSSAGERA